MEETVTQRDGRPVAGEAPCFYTYLHRRNDTGQVFYVGQGRGRRAWGKSDRNPHWKKVVAKAGYTVEILAQWPTKDDAATHEVLLISVFKGMAHPLVNMTDGGDGGMPGHKPSPETRAKRSASLRVAYSTEVARIERSRISSAYWSDPEKRARHLEITGSPEHRLKTSEASKAKAARPGQRETLSFAMKGVWQRPEFREKMRSAQSKMFADEDRRAKAVAPLLAAIKDPVVRKKMSDAAKRRCSEPGVKEAMSRRLKERLAQPGVLAKVSKLVQCVDTGVTYESINAAARALGIGPGPISEACRGKRRRAGGLVFRFVSLTPQAPA